MVFGVKESDYDIILKILAKFGAFARIWTN